MVCISKLKICQAEKSVEGLHFAPSGNNVAVLRGNDTNMTHISALSRKETMDQLKSPDKAHLL